MPDWIIAAAMLTTYLQGILTGFIIARSRAEIEKARSL